MNQRPHKTAFNSSAAVVPIGLALALGGAASAPDAAAQGCVSSPSCPLSPMAPGHHDSSLVAAHRWQTTVSYRWYESGRHFGGRARSGAFLDGDEENVDREKFGQQMINRVSTVDITISYGITSRWNANLTLPFLFAERSSVFEHTDGRRHSMYANGLGDLRFVSDYWLLDPHRHMDGNISVGVGFKAPTGDDHATDTSYRSDGRVTRPVDQSIQPGDGGWGLVLQLQAYQKVYAGLFAYVQGFYLIAPQEKNDTQTVMADMQPINVATYNSIPDQYFGRAGLSYLLSPDYGIRVSLGSRIEGVPVYDLVGDSLGFRQPGYTVSVEPGLSWNGKKNSLSILAPVAAYRIRERSAAEIARGRPGGDASFADYSILVSFTHHF